MARQAKSEKSEKEENRREKRGRVYGCAGNKAINRKYEVQEGQADGGFRVPFRSGDESCRNRFAKRVTRCEVRIYVIARGQQRIEKDAIDVTWGAAVERDIAC
jgi:hypothetical protein